MSDKEILEKLSNLHEQAINIIKEYNILARDNNQNTRMAYATASSYADDEEDDIDEVEIEENDDTDFYENKVKQIATDKNLPKKRKTNFEKVVQQSWGENVGISINSPEADMWFPSSICQ